MRLAFVEHTSARSFGQYITVDGTRLHYVDHGTGTPVVLLHGNGSMIGDFISSGIIEQLGRGYRVVAFDRPGFGYSERPSTRKWCAVEQAKLPPLVLPNYKLAKSPDEIRAIYTFAAEHPEVLGYMPCFCSCERLGHTSNDDCFVKTRARNGDVTEWQDHGMVCDMCLAVGETAMKMTAAGKPVREIRAEVERRFASATPYRTPTPNAPKS